MKSILLGDDPKTNKPFYLPVDAFRTHVHIPGATGKGKTTAILTLLYQLLKDRHRPACHVIVDFLGGLSWELLLWMSSRHCPQEVRDRLVLVQPSREEFVLPINPLLYDTLDHGFFKVNRATDLILRMWEAQNLGEQPRLARWLFNSFWACAQLGLTVADTVHLLLPGSPWHQPLLNALPDRLRYEWKEVLDARSAEAARILDSSRNRMKPFYESGILRNQFGSVANRFDALRFMREQRIVVLNLAPHNRLSPPEANAIAGLAVNEFLATARSLPRNIRYDTYLWLDEFQRMVTPDIEYAIPEVRQLGVRLVLAHQSFGQLKRKDVDLTSLIFQPQTRLVFGEQWEDADILAHELASITYDERRIKDEIYHLQQLQDGHRVVELSSWGATHTNAAQWSRHYSDVRSSHSTVSRRDGSDEATRGAGQSQAHNDGRGEGGASSDAVSRTTHEQMIANMVTIQQLASRTYVTFEEQRQIWAREVRNLRTGSCLARIVNDPTIYPVNVKQTRPGYLGFDVDTLYRKFPEAIEAMDRLIERNFQQDFFVSPQLIERETEERLRRVLRPTITVQSRPGEGGDGRALPPDDVLA